MTGALQQLLGGVVWYLVVLPQCDELGTGERGQIQELSAAEVEEEGGGGDRG